MRNNITEKTTKGARLSKPSRPKHERRVPVVESSGDVFADLGVALDEKEALKLAIAREITGVISKGKLTQTRVAEIIGTDQAKVSNLTRGRLKGFSLERLLVYLLLLGYDIDVHFSKQREAGADKGEVRFHHAMAM